MFCRFLGSGYGQFGGYGGGGMFLMMGFGFLIFLTLIYLAFKLMKSNTHFSLTNHSLANDSLLNNSALNILNERYAKGEIDEEEYTKKKMIVKKQGNPVPLTSNEFTILIALLTNPGQIFSREQLVTKAFGIDYDGFDRTADTHIKNIRQKIEHDPKNPRYILSVYGMGYKFNG